MAGAGIYVIYCVADGKAYVGEAKALRDRLRRHAADLRRGVHGNEHLQRAWLRHGPGAFVIGVLEKLSADTDEAGRVARENAWLQQVPRDMLFNLEVPAVASGFEPSAMRAALARPEVKARQVAGLRAALAAPAVRMRMADRQRSVRARGLPWATPRGENHCHAVLDEAAVRSIIAACAPDLKGRRRRGVITEQAQRYGVTQPTVSKILAGRLWRHVTR